MNIPEGMTEADVVKAIITIAASLSSRKLANYQTKEDVFQDCCCYAVEFLNNKEISKDKLYQALLVHCENRLNNFIRDHIYRCKPTCCANCEACENISGSRVQCKLYKYVEDCHDYKTWAMVNNDKRSIANIALLSQLDEIVDPNASVTKEAEYNRFVDAVDANVPFDLRKDWLRVRDGVFEKVSDSMKAFLTEYFNRYLGD